MPTKKDLSSEEIVEQHFPLYGPYDRDATVKAGYVVDELIRYLNYATQHAEGLPWPVAAYDLVGVLNTAAEKLPQALNQTARRVGAFAEDPRFVDRTGDWYRQPEQAHARAVERATEARASLQLAADLAGALAAQLAVSQNLLSSLGLNIPDEDDE